MKCVLIVDDNDANRYLLRALLQGHGYIVEEARHGGEALTRAQQDPPDLTISDLMMPVMDGYTLLRRWRADERLKTIPFVVYTATFTEPKDERLALALGANAFIVKPAEPEPFMVRIEEVLARTERGELLPASGDFEEAALVEAHNEILIRKLEKKALQLEQTNRELLEEIAERKRAETALRDSEERYRTLFDAITDPLLVYDRETLRYLSVNDAAVAEYGYSRDELLRMTIKDIRPPEDVPALLMLAGSGAVGEHRGFWRFRKKTGEIIEVDLTAYGLAYAGRPACLVHARDVTAQQQAERTLHLQDRAIQAVSQGILITDPKLPDNPIIYVSAGFERMTGYKADEVLGKNCRFLQGKDTDPETVGKVREAIADGRACAVEILNYRRDGTPFWNELSLNPVNDESGALSYFVGIQNEVTERRKLEDQLRQAQKMEAVGRLAGGVAHDFNNLLTVISGYSQLMLALPDIGPSLRRPIQAINDAGERAALLTRQLLGFSRQSILQPKVLDINTVVKNTGDLLRRLIGEDLVLTTVLAPTLSAVRVDPGQLDQILMNLAVNARDAMPKGGMLTMETSNVVLSDKYADGHLDCKAGHYVLLAITDTGCGMTPDVVARIFEPFFTTKDVGHGTGLGLAVVFGIVQQSGGCIHVYSEPGHGTTFRIYFPTVAEPVTKPRGTESELGETGTETILLVEDEQGVRGLAQLTLQLHGYTVLTALDGEDALRVVQSHDAPIDLVLTDVVMPNLSGPELARSLKTRLPQAKVLFMSGYTDDSVVRHGLLEHNVFFIQKPYTPIGLAQKVRQVLDGKSPAGE